MISLSGRFANVGRRSRLYFVVFEISLATRVAFISLQHDVAVTTTLLVAWCSSPDLASSDGASSLVVYLLLSVLPDSYGFTAPPCFLSQQ